MVVYLPYRSYNKSAKCLDDQRLNAQIVDGIQILTGLTLMDSKGVIKDGYPSGKGGWLHNPSLLMWIGYEDSLKALICSCVKEWEKRFNKKNLPDTFKLFSRFNSIESKPPWLNRSLILSHRSALIQANPYIYKKYRWSSVKIPIYWPYVWSPKKNKRIQIPPRVYKEISTKGESNYKRYIDVIKKHGIKWANKYNSSDDRSLESWGKVILGGI